MKKILKTIIPKKIIRLLGQGKLITKTLFVFIGDFLFYVKYSGVASLSKRVLIFRLIKNYHKIEKGLTLEPRRLFFGNAVINQIVDDINYLISNQATEYELFEIKNGIASLDFYLNVHNDKKPLTEFIIKYNCLIERLHREHSIDTDSLVPVKSCIKENISLKDVESYKKVISNRVSIRDFKSNPVDDELFTQSVQIALDTPSVCNRQAWSIFRTTSAEKIKQALQFQNGNRGFEHKIHDLLIVTMNLSAFLSPEERSQYMFDAGLFSMNLVNALALHGIDSCFLNLCVDNSTDKGLKKVLSIPKYHKAVVMIAIGYRTANVIVCSSSRKSVHSTLNTVS